MDNELEQLEAELRRLRPRQVSSLLMEEIRSTVEIHAPSRARRLWWWALPLVGAATVVMMLVVQFKTRTAERPGEATEVASSAPPTFKPVAATDVLVDSREETGLILTDGTRARRVRETYLDTITWRDPRTNASLRWTVPREEVRVVPVSYQ